MANCEKCGQPLDENGVCANCLNSESEQADNIWARPGAKAKEPAEKEPSDKTIPDTEKINASDADNASDPKEKPKLAASQIGTAEQRAAYFNAIAGVEEEEVDEQFYVSENSLFDVPFNDTNENLGYEIPKFRNTMTKKTRKKLRIGGIVLAALALLTAGAIVLSNYFNVNIGIFESAPEVPVLYLKGTSAYLTTSKGGIPGDIHYSDRIGTLTNSIFGGEIKRLAFTPDYKRMLVVEEYDSSSGMYTLYERETYSDKWKTEENNGTLVDNGICSPYKLICGGSSIIYLKLSGDIPELCVYSFSDGTVKKIDSGVTYFSVLDENRVLYLLDGNMHTLTYKSHSDFSTNVTVEYVEQVFTAYDYGYTDKADYFYLTIKAEYVTEDTYYNSGELHFVKDGKDTVIDSGVSEVVMPCFADGTAYYYKSEYLSLGVSDFIEDDCEESDAKYVEVLSADEDIYTTSKENWAKYLRYNLRNIKYGSQTFSVFNSGVKSEIKSDLWYTDGKNGTKLAENVTAVISTDEKSKTIVYKNRVYNIEKVLFSEVDQSYIQYAYSLVSYCSDILLPEYTTTQFGVSSGEKSAVLEASYIRQAECTSDATTLYYIDTEKEKTETGMLKSINLTDFSACETVVETISSFEVVGNAVVSMGQNGEMYYNNEKIGQNVESYQAAENGNTVVFLSDYDSNSGVGTLKCIRNNNVETICSDIHSFAVYAEETLAYVGDYNKAEKVGYLYIASSIKEGKATANEAQSLIRY